MRFKTTYNFNLLLSKERYCVGFLFASFFLLVANIFVLLLFSRI